MSYRTFDTLRPVERKPGSQPGTATGPRGRLGSQRPSSRRDVQINSAVPVHWDALRAETASRSAPNGASRNTSGHELPGLTFARLTPLVLVAMLALSSGCSKPDQPGAAPAPEKAAEAESRVKHGTNGEVILTLDGATQKAMGLEVGALSAARVSPEVKGYGHVLDVSPLAALLADLATAQAASEASEAEFKRLKTLAAQNNASDRALQAAEAAATRDRAQADSTRLKLLANWGSAIAARQDLPAFVHSLGSLTTALIELDLPAGDSIEATPTGARLLTLANPAKTIEAQFIGPAPMVEAQMQGRGFLFLVDPNTSNLAPGAAVSGFLTLPGEAQSGVTVPRESVIRYNGATWVYRQTGNETFERLEITLDRPLENGWFVREGLKPGDKLVTAGAQQMLSEELKGSGE